MQKTKALLLAEFQSSHVEVLLVSIPSASVQNEMTTGEQPDSAIETKNRRFENLLTQCHSSTMLGASLGLP